MIQERMMREGDYINGVVSLWVGTSPSQDALANYVEMDFSINNPSHLSQFAKDFGTGWYDHDSMEREAERPTRSLSQLLRGCSYDWIIVPEFVKLRGESLPMEVNAFVLLYDFQHNGSIGPGADSGGPVKLRYMGSIKVDTPWPD